MILDNIGYDTYADKQKKIALFIFQDDGLFGERNSKWVRKIDLNKWTSSEGYALAYIPNQGEYKGNFDFVYELVDSID